jgi:hypothetical protein
MNKTRISIWIGAIALVAGGVIYAYQSAMLESMLASKKADEQPHWSFGQAWFSPRLESAKTRVLAARPIRVDKEQDVRLSVRQTSANGQGQDVRLLYWLIDENGERKTDPIEVQGHDETSVVFPRVPGGSYQVVAQTVGVLDSVGEGRFID